MTTTQGKRRFGLQDGKCRNKWHGYLERGIWKECQC